MKRLLLFMLLFYPLHHAFAENKPEQLGQITYQMACQSCHAPDYAKGLKAPAAFDKKAWQMRITKARQAVKEDERFDNEYQYLVYQVKIGKGLMHHHGLCLEKAKDKSHCSDEALTQAIKYMALLD